MPSYDPTFPLYPTLSFLGFLLSVIPLPWHIQAWNSGTCAFMIWTGVTCLNGFINSLVWSGNLRNVAPVWCDISSKIIIGASIGIPAATLCISRRLYTITAVQTVSITRQDRLRMIGVDLCIAVGIPLIIMVLHVVVQAHRFDIFEDIGCYPVVYNTLPAYFLYFMWPPLLGVVSFVYSSLTLRSFWRRRLQFNELLSSNTSLSASRYFRLVLLAVVDIMFTIPLGIYSIYIGNKGVGLAPWISWEETHFNFARVAQVPTLFWRSDRSTETAVELTRWLPVFCAFLFFALFGFAAEAQKHYRLLFWRIAGVFGFRPSSTANSKGSLSGLNAPKHKPIPSVGSLPAYTHKSAFAKSPRRHSLSSTGIKTELELDTYAEVDVEKSAGFASPSTSSIAPPEYTHQRNNNLSLSQENNAPAQSFSPSLRHSTSTASLQTVESQPYDRIYISDAFPAPGDRTRPPSPAPFTDATIPSYHRPFTPPTAPHLSTRGFADAIRVIVYTHSQSTDAP